MTVFDAFKSTDYTFLQLSKGGVLGDTVAVETNATGVFKERDGRNQFNQNMTTVDSDATLHIRPSEPFLATLDYNLVGNGVRHQGQDYMIVGQTTGRGGTDFSTIEHYRVTLRREELGVSNG